MQMSWMLIVLALYAGYYTISYGMQVRRGGNRRASIGIFVIGGVTGTLPILLRFLLVRGSLP